MPKSVNPKQIGALKMRSAMRRNSGLTTMLGLSSAAIGWSNLSSASDGQSKLQTLMLPGSYTFLEDGTVVFSLETGEQLALLSDQYVILEGGLLMIVDELAQDAMAALPIMGSLRTQLLSEVQPVRSPDGTIVETSDRQPLWSGDGPTPRLFEEINVERYEIAQTQVEEDDNDEALLLGAAGSTLAGLGLTWFGLMRAGGAEAEDAEDAEDGTGAGGDSGDGGDSGAGGSDGGSSGGGGSVPWDAQKVTDQSFTSYRSLGQGDVYGDGVGDALIWNDDGGVTIVRGSYINSDPSLIDLTTLGNNGVALSSWGGSQITRDRNISTFDFDGDPYADVLVGNGTTAYLIYGSHLQANFGSTIDPTSLQAGEGFEITGGSLDAEGNVGDIDGDGRDDIVIADGVAETYGVKYVIFSGGFDHSVTSFSVSGIDQSSGIKIRDEYPQPSGWFPQAQKLGAIVSDGNGGLYVAMEQGATSGGFPWAGVRHVSAADLQGIPASGWVDLQDYDPMILTTGGELGVLDMVNVGDLIGDDGKDDIVIVGEFSNAGTDSAGAVLIDATVFDRAPSPPVIFINDPSLFHMWGKSDSTGDPGWTQIGNASAADVDGDGMLDLIIGEDNGGVVTANLPNSEPNGVYVIFGSYLSTTDDPGFSDGALDLWPVSLDPTKFVHLKSSEADSSYTQSPWAVSGLDDIDGDGYDEVMMSAEGETYLISGAEIVSASQGSGQIDVTVDYTY